MSAMPWDAAKYKRVIAKVKKAIHARYQSTIDKLKEQLLDANTMLVMQDHATQYWPAKAPLEKRHATILIRFLNEFAPQVTLARRKSIKEIVVTLQDALDEIPQLPRDPEAEAKLWIGADGVPLKIAEMPANRFVNVLRFAYRGFLDRENPARWENLLARAGVLGLDVEKSMRRWDRDEREKLAALMERERRALPDDRARLYTPALGEVDAGEMNAGGGVTCARHPRALFTGGSCVDCANEGIGGWWDHHG